MDYFLEWGRKLVDSWLTLVFIPISFCVYFWNLSIFESMVSILLFFMFSFMWNFTECLHVSNKSDTKVSQANKTWSLYLMMSAYGRGHNYKIIIIIVSTMYSRISKMMDLWDQENESHSLFYLYSWDSAWNRLEAKMNISSINHCASLYILKILVLILIEQLIYICQALYWTFQQCHKPETIINVRKQKWTLRSRGYINRPWSHN